MEPDGDALPPTDFSVDAVWKLGPLLGGVAVPDSGSGSFIDDEGIPIAMTAGEVDGAEAGDADGAPGIVNPPELDWAVVVGDGALLVGNAYTELFGLGVVGTDVVAARLAGVPKEGDGAVGMAARAAGLLPAW